jgi:hypothetical protein
MAKQLDPGLFERSKSGFVLPIEKWCRQSLKNDISQTFSDHNRLARIGLNAEAVNSIWQAFLADSPGLYWSSLPRGETHRL